MTGSLKLREWHPEDVAEVTNPTTGESLGTIRSVAGKAITGIVGRAFGPHAGPHDYLIQSTSEQLADLVGQEVVILPIHRWPDPAQDPLLGKDLSALEQSGIPGDYDAAQKLRRAHGI